MIADAERQAVVQPVQLDAGVFGAGGEDHQGPQAKAALDRPLRDVGVLYPRTRHVDDASTRDVLFAITAHFAPL